MFTSLLSCTASAAVCSGGMKTFGAAPQVRRYGRCYTRGGGGGGRLASQRPGVGATFVVGSSSPAWSSFSRSSIGTTFTLSGCPGSLGGTRQCTSPIAGCGAAELGVATRRVSPSSSASAQGAATMLDAVHACSTAWFAQCRCHLSQTTARGQPWPPPASARAAGISPQAGTLAWWAGTNATAASKC